MTKESPKVNAKDWRNLPIEKWNTSTIHAYLIDETLRKYNAEYAPGGGGAKSKRWAMEKGMIKRELTKRGAAEVEAFIDICWREYFTSDKRKYPYPNFAFMLGFMDRYWPEAKATVVRSETEVQTGVDEVNEEWF